MQGMAMDGSKEVQSCLIYKQSISGQNILPYWKAGSNMTASQNWNFGQPNWIDQKNLLTLNDVQWKIFKKLMKMVVDIMHIQWVSYFNKRVESYEIIGQRV